MITFQIEEDDHPRGAGYGFGEFMGGEEDEDGDDENRPGNDELAQLLTVWLRTVLGNNANVNVASGPGGATVSATTTQHTSDTQERPASTEETQEVETEQDATERTTSDTPPTSADTDDTTSTTPPRVNLTEGLDPNTPLGSLAQ